MSSSRSTSDSTNDATAPQEQNPFPRGAVSTVVRYHSHHSDDETPRYLLIERGNPPNRGVWCVPGGKIEWGGPTLAAAQRELAEEVKFSQEETIRVAWYSGGAFCTSDSIHTPSSAGTNNKEGYHYLIAQCFAEIVVDTTIMKEPPKVEPADDAQGAKWWTLEEIQQAQVRKETVPNLAVVIERAEALYQCGMLPTTHIQK